MERLRDFMNDRTGLGVVCFLLTKAVLFFVDISCVGVFFGITLNLIYLTFLKDCLEIFIYAVAKFCTRLKWLYRIFKVQEFLCIEENELDITERNEQESNILSNSDESISEQISPSVVRNSLDLAASSSCNSTSQFNSQLLLSYSQSRNTSEVEGGNRSSVIFESPQSRKSGSSDTLPRKLSSLSTQIVSSTDNFTINETNFEDVNLSDEMNDIESKTFKEELNEKQNPSKWNIGKIKFLDSFRKSKLLSPGSVKSQIGNLATKVTEVLPQQADDNEKLIDKNDSPEQVGCCSYLPHFLRPNQMSSIASYARF